MVFETLFLKGMYNKRYVFPLTVFYALASILLARFIFGSNSGIVSVVFLSIFLIPFIRKILDAERSLEFKEKYFSFRHFLFNNKNIFGVYFLVFFAVFFTYLFSTFLLPQFGISVFNVFQEQLFLDSGLRGGAFSVGTFWSILTNNWIVLIVCFLLGLIFGEGVIFFISWNASAWGAIFGYKAWYAGVATNSDPWVFLWLLLGIVLWHTLIEGSAYILAAISGSIISKEVVSDLGQKQYFFVYFIFGGAVTFFLMSVINFGSVFLSFFSSLIIFLTWIYFMKVIFKNEKHELVFRHNYWLLLFAILVFVIGVVLETYVLSSSSTLMNIYSYSSSFS